MKLFITLDKTNKTRISANCSVPFLSQYTWHSSTVTNSSQGAGNGDFSVFKPEKHLLLQYWLCQTLQLCRSQQTRKFFKRREYQTTWPASWEICMQGKKQQLELDMDQQTGSKLGKKYVKAVHCHPAYLTYMQSTSREMLGWMKYRLESRLPGEISITSDTQMTPPLWQKVKRNSKASWWKWKWRVKKLA